MANDLDIERAFQTRPTPGSLFETYADKVMRRVDEVLNNQECHWLAGPEERYFLQLLRTHQGKSRAVALSVICAKMQISPRKVKELVQTLRQDFGVQLAASRGEDSGYYLAATLEESEEAIHHMLRQAVTMLRVVARMRGGKDSIEQMLTQIRLDLTAPDQEGTHVK